MVCVCLMRQEYRPGMTRADVEDDQRRQRVRDGLEPQPPPRMHKHGAGERLDDGSFPRSGAWLKCACTMRCQVHTDETPGEQSCCEQQTADVQSWAIGLKRRRHGPQGMSEKERRGARLLVLRH